VNLAPRRPRGAFFLEKWYADVLLPDGAVLIVYLARLRVLGLPIGRVTAELHPCDGASLRGDSPASRWQGGEDWLRAGPARIDGERLSFRAGGLEGDLRYVPRWPAAVLRQPFLRDGSRSLHWTIEVPDADVSGRLRGAGESWRIEGRGYRDRVWFDARPWRFPIRELRWGRAAAGPHASTWVSASTRVGDVSGRWCDGRVLGDGDAGSPPLSLGEPRVLVETRVADLEGLRLGALRPLLRRLALDPHELKCAAPARIAGHEGRAVHEVVRWS
jgi:hypothetical protein